MNIHHRKSLCTRKDRLLEYESSTGVIVFLDDTVGSYIFLPYRIMQFVFIYLSVHEIKHVCLTCYALKKAVCKYLSDGGSRRFACEVMKDDSVLHKRKRSYTWGNLLKMCTVFWPARSRRNFMHHFYLKFCRNWDYLACGEFFDSVIKFTDSELLLCIVMSGEVGEHYLLEMEIRQRFRGFFIDQLQKSELEQGFWVSALLSTQKDFAEKGRLFMILFGPLKYIHGTERIDWHILSETLLTRNQCIQTIKPLSLNLYCLAKTIELNSKFSWSDAEIFTLIEEITSVPQLWLFHNFASLLLLQPELIPIAFYSRILCGQCNEAAHILHIMKTVCCRWEYDIMESLLRPLLETFKLLSTMQRRNFLAEIILTQSHLLSEYLQQLTFDRIWFLDELTASSVILQLLAAEI